MWFVCILQCIYSNIVIVWCLWFVCILQCIYSNIVIVWCLWFVCILQCIYSNIPLIRHTWYSTGTSLSNIPDYWTVPILTKVLTGIFFWNCSYTWVVQLIWATFHLDISFSWWLRGISVILVPSWRVIYICQLQLDWRPVAVVQYTFTHKQYIEQHK